MPSPFNNECWSDPAIFVGAVTDCYECPTTDHLGCVLLSIFVYNYQGFTVKCSGSNVGMWGISDITMTLTTSYGISSVLVCIL